MKRMYALLTAIMMAAAIALPSHASSKSPKPAAIQDTLIMKLRNEARLLIVVKDVKDLKSLKSQSIDSIMLLVEKYADQIEAAGKKGDEVTVTIDKSSANTADDVNITITQHGPEGTEVTIKEKNRIRITDKIGIDIDRDEDNNSTKVKVNVGQGDSTEIRERDEKRYKNRNPRQEFDFQIDLGVSHWMNKEEQAGSPVQDIKLRPLASRYISLNSKWHYRLGGEASPLRLITGFTFDFHNYMFDDNIIISQSDEGTQFSKAVDMNIDKSKLATTSFNVPLELGLDFKNRKGKTNFKIGGGGFVGYMLSSHSKLKYSQDGENHKSKTKDDFFLNDFQYGVSGFIGVRSLEFFVKYNLNEVFEENKGPQANAIAAGVRIMKF
ncbi:outer membrane beta-barrel protein [Rufibacter sediminis]|uniref:PorT family protein n=1 Tax=Rufibacter sediminis TaxID=2762756 RepID=A0ABR6VWH3_9BACT|nr:outer membrane beta-barrel protein [Rufibacter sediminis]MBC3541549.1 PorT family protein [Rufibacter sediminis]